jgi:hypothetical protein
MSAAALIQPHHPNGNPPAPNGGSQTKTELARLQEP